MSLRRYGLAVILSGSVAVACAAGHKLEPPDGITAQDGGAQAGNGLGSDVESGTTQYDPSAPAAFAPGNSTVIAELAAWEAMAGTVAPSLTSATETATATDTPTNTPCTSGCASPTPTPSAAPSVTPPPSATPT